MELSNEFTVDVSVDRAWEVLTDVPMIAPCLPGAQLKEVEGEEYRGIVKVKVGPITAQYKGKATFVESDRDAGRIVLHAEGRETRGQGNAKAIITAELHPDGERTRVTVSTDLTVTGKVAQFGRGVMADVSAKLMDQFADNLRSTVLADGAVPQAEAQAESPSVTTFDLPEPEPVDLLEAAGAPVLKRALPALGLVVVLALVVAVVLRRRRG